jgi:hypothetical protein
MMQIVHNLGILENILILVLGLYKQMELNQPASRGNG